MLPAVVHNCLMWSHDKFETQDMFGMHDLLSSG